jgi:WD40 repeat protein
VTSVQFGFVAGGSVMATGSWDGTAIIWDANVGRQINVFEGNIGRISTIALCTGSRRDLLAACGNEGGTCVWDLGAGESFRPFTDDFVTSVAIGVIGGGTVLATGARDGAARLWDLSRGWSPVYLARLTGHEDRITSVAFGAVGNRTLLATGSWDGTAGLWDVGRRTLVRTISGHSERITSVAMETIGGRPVLATGSDDGTARLWDPMTGNGVRAAARHQGSVTSVALGEIEGRAVLATGCDDGTVRLWGVGEDPQPLSLLNVPVGSEVRSVAFNKSGKLAVTTDRGIVVLHRFDLSV